MAEAEAEADRGSRNPSAQGPLLHVAVEHLDGSAVVRLDGELDLSSADVFDRAVRPLLHRYDGAQMTLDCSRLTFIDSTGVWHLVALARAVDSGRISLTGASQFLLRVLTIMGTERLFDIAS